MPTFKHPCPHCGAFIARDVAACPYCATRDPFVLGRCASCRAPIEDASWVACPKCGASLRPAPGAPVTSASPPAAPAPPAIDAGGRCAGCGGALAAGATFCPACGTLVG